MAAWTRRGLRCAALAALLCAAPGCAFVAGVEESFEPTSRAEVFAADWPDSKAYVRTFISQSVVGRSTVMVSGPGGTATGVGETVGTSSQVPTWIVNEAQRAFPFRAISTVLGLGEAPRYVLEGSLKFQWDDQWWTWAQIVDLWVHAWFLPTLGRYLVLDFELNLYDSDQVLVRTWTGRRTIKYVGQLWWGIAHGGAGGSGFEEDYTQYLQDAFAAVGKDMRALVARSPRSRPITDTMRPPIPAAAPTTTPAPAGDLASRVQQLQKGRSTRADVRASFGEPTQVTQVGAVERWTYVYPGAVGRAVVVDFDASGVVCDHAYSEQAAGRSGQDIDAARVRDIRTGVTTQAQVRQWFGEPQSTAPLGTGVRWTYTNVVEGRRPRVKALVVDFDATGTVCDQGYTEQ